MEIFPNDICLSRNQGNPESAAAHAAILPGKNAARTRVLEHIRNLKTKGGNNWEMAQHWGIEQSSISPRVTELLVTGEVVDSHIRRPTRSGNMARVVIAVEFRPALIVELKAKAAKVDDQMEREYLLTVAEVLAMDERRAAVPDDWEARIDESY